MTAICQGVRTAAMEKNAFVCECARVLVVGLANPNNIRLSQAAFASI